MSAVWLRDRRAGIAMAMVTWASAAAAQPVTRPEPIVCTVRVVAAPDEVRSEIEAWVRAEPRCDRALEVRVVAVQGGYHLMARDDNGQLRERIVPDAQSAAVLVVSWMADDSISAPPPDIAAHVDPVVAPVVPVEAPTTEDTDVALTSPGVTRVSGVGRAREPRRWLTLGGFGSSVDRIGVRGQLDVLGGARWTAGIAGAWRAGGGEHDGDGPMRPGTSAGLANVFVGATHAVGPIVLRAQLGLGVDVRADDRMTERGGTVIAPAVSAGAFAAWPLTRSWGVIGGPTLDVRLAPDAGSAEVSLFLGVQYGR